MRSKDNLNLEEAYKTINNKEKELISEDANETLGAGIVYLVAFGIPVVLDYFSRKYPKLKDALIGIKNDYLNDQKIKEEVKAALKQAKQNPQPRQDGISPMLTGGVRKQPPNFKG